MVMFMSYWPLFNIQPPKPFKCEHFCIPSYNVRCSQQKNPIWKSIFMDTVSKCLKTGYAAVQLLDTILFWYFFLRERADRGSPSTDSHCSCPHGPGQSQEQKLNHVFPPWVSGTQLFEPLLLPRRNYISKNLGSRVKAKCQTQALKCGVPVS